MTPTFIRLPSPKESCPHTGYSRTGLYNLTVPCRANQYRPPVPAKCDRKPGNMRGIWLIPYQALIDYINALPTPGMAEANDSSACGHDAQGDPAMGSCSPARNSTGGSNCFGAVVAQGQPAP